MILSQFEIEKQVTELLNELHSIQKVAHFELNPRIQEIYSTLNLIRAKCKHEYDENKTCVWCKKKNTHSTNDNL